MILYGHRSFNERGFMKTALIGYTGFVGGNIKSQHEFDDYYNSKNIADIESQEYDSLDRKSVV